MPEITKFSEWLAQHRRGELDDELSAALVEITQAVGLIGKAGRLTIQVSVKANGPGARTLTVVDKVSVLKPESEREQAIYYVDDHSRLHRNDPWQERLPMRSLDEEKGAKE